MQQEQQDNVNTTEAEMSSEHDTSTEREKVDFTDISLDKVQYSDKFLARLGTTAQLVKAFIEMSNTFSSGTKVATNKYQEALYPRIAKLSAGIGTKYQELFLSEEMDPLRRQVFGANLNGALNNGLLRRSVKTDIIRPDLQYGYAQFGELLRILFQRVDFITTRDPLVVDRYLKNVDQRTEFLELQSRCVTFKDYLLKENDPTCVTAQWDATLKELEHLKPKREERTDRPKRKSNVYPERYKERAQYKVKVQEREQYKEQRREQRDTTREGRTEYRQYGNQQTGRQSGRQFNGQSTRQYNNQQTGRQFNDQQSERQYNNQPTERQFNGPHTEFTSYLPRKQQGGFQHSAPRQQSNGSNGWTTAPPKRTAPSVDERLLANVSQAPLVHSEEQEQRTYRPNNQTDDGYRTKLNNRRPNGRFNKPEVSSANRVPLGRKVQF